MTSVEPPLRAFICENFFTDDADLTGDVSLTRSGIMDSTGVMEIILFLETQFGMKVPDRDAVPENLDTLNNLVRYVSSRLPKAVAP
ncbi:MAG: acyl carrier protein [Gemmataceae bacterium]